MLLAASVPALILTAAVSEMTLGAGSFCASSFSGAFGFTMMYAVLFGLPTAAAFRRLHWTHPLAVLAGGFVLGSVPAIVFESPILLPLGALAAAIFWRVLKACGAWTAGDVPLRPYLGGPLALLSLAFVILLFYALPSCPRPEWD